MKVLVGVLLAALCSLFVTSGPAVADCTHSCGGGGSGPCDGVSSSTSIECGPQRCLVIVSATGNGDSDSERRWVDADGQEKVTVCLDASSGGTCCVQAQPCSGSDWSDAGGDCAAMCASCDAY